MHIYMILQITLAVISIVLSLYSLFSESKQSSTPDSTRSKPTPRASVAPAEPALARPPVPGARAIHSVAATRSN
jgi:hypothetical protein